MKKTKKESNNKDYIKNDKYQMTDSLIQDAKNSLIKLKELNLSLSKEIDYANRTLKFNGSDNLSD